jgi:hypothetical protein
MALLLKSADMNNRSTSTSRTSQFITNGISLTEMLVAIILLSLVTGFAFTAISTMRKNYLVEAAIASDRISTTMALTSLARQYYENPDFARNAPAAYPVTDDIDDSRLTILSLRGGQSSYDASGAVRCVLTNIDTGTSSATIPAACLAAYRLTPDDVITTFQHIALPVIFPEWSAEPCLINQMVAEQNVIRFTVYNAACLSAGIDAGQPSRQAFHLPRLVALSHNRKQKQDMILGEAAASDHHLASPGFINHPVRADGIWINSTSTRPADRFAVQPVSLFQFGGTAWILPPLIHGLSAVELHIESPTDTTLIMRDCTQAGQQSLRLNGLTPAMLASVFYGLCFQRQGHDTAELMITISGGNSQWRRGISFRYMPAP